MKRREFPLMRFLTRLLRMNISYKQNEIRGLNYSLLINGPAVAFNAFEIQRDLPHAFHARFSSAANVVCTALKSSRCDTRQVCDSIKASVCIATTFSMKSLPRIVEISSHTRHAATLRVLVRQSREKIRSN